MIQKADQLIAEFGRPLTLDSLRLALDDARSRLKADPEADSPSVEGILAEARSYLAGWAFPSLRRVINATGVILHTNLGRAPISDAAIRAMSDAGTGYTNLEFDLVSGKRGSRLIHAEAVLQKLLNVEAALVVNNNASAVLLVLSALANKKRVVIPRSQLVEIGGGFRVPDVMKESGAKIAEIGTTNKVRLSDYTDALREPAALVMRAHRSNFKIIGFTEEPDLEKIVEVAHMANTYVVDDLGSGALFDTTTYGLAHEPTVQESLAAGVDIVCFSGDKLMGGPQAGIIVGRKDLLGRIRKHPLARAVRADKTCLAGTAATLIHHLKNEAAREVPIVRMMSLTPESIKIRAEAWQAAVGRGEVIPAESTVGGGSLPEESLPTYVLSLDVKSPSTFLAKLRESDPPIIARTVSDNVLLDPRTVLEDEELIRVLKGILHAYH